MFTMTNSGYFHPACNPLAVVCDYHVFVGKVELPGVFEDEMLTLFPLRVLIFQVNSESFDVFDPCGDTATVSARALPLNTYTLL